MNWTSAELGKVRDKAKVSLDCFSLHQQLKTYVAREIRIFACWMCGQFGFGGQEETGLHALGHGEYNPPSPSWKASAAKMFQLRLYDKDTHTPTRQLKLPG